MSKNEVMWLVIKFKTEIVLGTKNISLADSELQFGLSYTYLFALLLVRFVHVIRTVIYYEEN